MARTRWKHPTPMVVRPEDRAARAATELSPKIGLAWLALVVGGVIALALAGHNATPMERGQVEPTRGAALFAAPPTKIVEPTPTEPAMQAVAFAPGGELVAEVPTGLPLSYQDSTHPGWAGVEWRGAVVWVKVGGDLSGLPDLAPRRSQAAPPAQAPIYQPASLPDAATTHHEKPHDETR